MELNENDILICIQNFREFKQHCEYKINFTKQNVVLTDISTKEYFEFEFGKFKKFLEFFVNKKNVYKF